MATAPKAAKPAESAKPKAEKPKADPSKALAEALGQDEADTAKPEKAKKEPPKKLALNEVEGEIKVGSKIRIGIAQFDAPLRESDRVSTAPFVVPDPKNLRVVGPASRPNTSHVIDTTNAGKTLCRLPTNWTSGVKDHGSVKDAYIECQPCARRLIAVQQLKQADHDKHRAAFLKAREDAKKAAAEQKAAEKVAKAAKATEAAKPEPAKPEATPDPKAKPRKRTKKPAAA